MNFDHPKKTKTGSDKAKLIENRATIIENAASFLLMTPENA